MSYEIGEILGKLEENNIIDFEDQLPIILIHRSKNPINFEINKLLEVKRFSSLVGSHMRALTYLSRNLSFKNITREVERNDRIMGAVNYRKTALLRKQSLTNSRIAVCTEIHRSNDTPENLLLALVLFSIMLYCDKYLKLSGLIEWIERIDPTIRELQSIRSHTSILLSVKAIREILPLAIDSIAEIDRLLHLMLRRIQQGKVPKYFTKIYSLYSKLRYYVLVSSTEQEIVKHILQYHFMYLSKLHDLYECWVFCKILYGVAQKYDIRLKEIHSSKGVAVFKAVDGSFHIIYQARYNTKWRDQGTYIEDVPDITIESKTGRTIVIDAKYEEYTLSTPKPNLFQMRSYMTTLNGTYGIFIHSKSDDPSIWKEITSEGDQKIIWTSLIPENSKTNANLEKIIQRIKDTVVYFSTRL